MTQQEAFAETCLLGVGDRFVHRSYFRARCFSEIEVIAPLRILSLHGPGLARIGATSAVASGSHVASRDWSRAIYEHPDLPDGIAYRSKHDDGEHCIALFGRASDSIVPAGSPQPMINHSRLAVFCARYGIGFA